MPEVEQIQGQSWSKNKMEACAMEKHLLRKLALLKIVKVVIEPYLFVQKNISK